MDDKSQLRAGDWVEVRSKEEILATLDKQGRLETLPFMPEMFEHCGQRFQVFKRAHKTCDPPSGMQARRMPNAVHLAGVRCDGAGHGGCQAGCLIFWKDAWLKAVDAPRAAGTTNATCTEADVVAAVHRAGSTPAEPIYACQSTELFSATSPLPWWHLQQYIEDVRSGNVRASQLASALAFYVYHEITQAGLGIGSAMRWAYDAVQKIRGGAPYPWRKGKIPKGV